MISIAGNLPAISEIAPLLIVIKLEQFDVAGAAAIGIIMLAASFALILALNLLQNWLLLAPIEKTAQESRHRTIR